MPLAFTLRCISDNGLLGREVIKTVAEMGSGLTALIDWAEARDLYFRDVDTAIAWLVSEGIDVQAA